MVYKFDRFVDLNKIDTINNKFVTTTSTNDGIETYINVQCTLKELKSIFYTYDRVMYDANMKELYGSAFATGKFRTLESSKYIIEKEAQFYSRTWKYIKQYEQSEAGAVISILTIVPESVDKTKVVGISALYLISALQITDVDKSNFNVTFKGVSETNSRANKKLLQLLSNALKKLPEIIMSRRILIQKFIDKDICHVDNTRCISCVKPVSSLFHTVKRCCLCGYNICKQCGAKHTIYYEGEYSDVIICCKCAVRLNHCDYTEVDFNVNPYKRITNDRDDYNAGYNAFLWMTNTPDLKPLIRAFLKSNSFHSMWKHELHDFLIKSKPIKSCTVCGDLRPYLMNMSTDRNEIIAPANEIERLVATNKIDLTRFRGNETLMSICEFINKELDGFAAMVVVVRETVTEVIASSDVSTMKVYPKSESICQHMVMTGIPLLINNPESDVRFCYLSSIETIGYKFYFSVPIFSNDGFIIGSFCILGESPRAVTRSQYSIMIKMSSAITHILYKSISLDL